MGIAGLPGRKIISSDTETWRTAWAAATTYEHPHQDSRPARTGRTDRCRTALVFFRVLPARHRQGGADTVAGTAPDRNGQSGLCLGGLWGGRLLAGAHHRAHPEDRGGHHAASGRSSHRGRPLRGGTAGDRGRYADAGIRDVVVLRGDPPGDPQGPWVPHPGGLEHAADLGRFVRDLGDFRIGVAAFPERHPRLPDWDSGMRHFIAKCRAGADYAITQMFFDADDYSRLGDRLTAVGCDTPVIPEIMPATSFDQISRFARLSNSTFPDNLDRRLENARHDPRESHCVGVALATALAQRLLDEGFRPSLRHPQPLHRGSRYPPRPAASHLACPMPRHPAGFLARR